MNDVTAQIKSVKKYSDARIFNRTFKLYTSSYKNCFQYQKPIKRNLNRKNKLTSNFCMR